MNEKGTNIKITKIIFIQSCFLIIIICSTKHFLYYSKDRIRMNQTIFSYIFIILLLFLACSRSQANKRQLPPHIPSNVREDSNASHSSPNNRTNSIKANAIELGSNDTTGQGMLWALVEDDEYYAEYEDALTTTSTTAPTTPPTTSTKRKRKRKKIKTSNTTPEEYDYDTSQYAS